MSKSSMNYKFLSVGLIGIFVLSCLFFGCGSEPQKETPKGTEPVKAKESEAGIVAKVGSRTITADQIKTEMTRRGGAHPEKLNKKQILDEMVDNELMVAKAIEVGLDKDPDVIRSYQNVLIGKLRQKEMATRIDKGAITDDEIKTYYETNRNNYTRPARARLALLYLKTDPGTPPEKLTEIQSKMAEAKKKATQAPDPSGFGALANEYSDDPASKTKGGDIGWVDQGRPVRWDAKVVEAAFAIQTPGEISEVITTDKGVYLVKLLERQESVVSPLEQVKEGVRNTILFDKRKTFEKTYKEELRAAIPVQINAEALEAVPLPTPPKAEAPKQPDTPRMPPGAMPQPPAVAPGGQGAGQPPAGSTTITLPLQPTGTKTEESKGHGIVEVQPQVLPMKPPAAPADAAKSAVTTTVPVPAPPSAPPSEGK